MNDNRDGLTLRLGLIADPDFPEQLSNRLVDELPKHLRDDETWEIDVEVDPVAAGRHGTREILDAARERVRDTRWDYAIVITDLPVRRKHRPVLAEADVTARVAVVSLPALGGAQPYRRARQVVVQLLDEFTINDARRASGQESEERHGLQSTLTGLLAPISRQVVEEPDAWPASGGGGSSTDESVPKQPDEFIEKQQQPDESVPKQPDESVEKQQQPDESVPKQADEASEVNGEQAAVDSDARGAESVEERSDGSGDEHADGSDAEPGTDSSSGTDESTGRTDESTGRTDESTGRTDESTGRTDESSGDTDESSGEQGDVDVRYLGTRMRGRLRLLTGMVRTNRPWRLIFGLSSALAAALATSAFGLSSSTIWQISDQLTTVREVLSVPLAVGVLVLWLVAAHHLWERTGRGGTPDREQVVLYNASTVLTLTIGVSCMYIMLFGVNLGVAYFLVPSGLLSSTLGAPAGFGAYLTLAWGFTTMGMIAGALGSSLESDQAVRQAAYGYREEQRRRMHQEAQSHS